MQHTQKPAGISLCMIVRDEEEFLPDALASVRDVVDEICIVDTGSSDRTIEIALAAGARVERIAWPNDFSKARNVALSMARKRWILVLDADERLSPKSRDAVKAIGTQPAALSGFWTRCFNFTEDYKGTGAMSNALVRLFPNNERIRYRNPVHEFVALDGDQAGLPASLSDVEIVHLGYMPDVMRARRKDERNRALALAALERDPSDAYHWYNYATSSMLAGEPAVARNALEKMQELFESQRPPGVPAFLPNGLVLLGSLYLDVALPQRAETVARRAVELTQTFADAHFLLGKALVAQRRYAEAREAFIASIEDGKHVDRHPFVDNEIPLWKAHSEIGGTLMEEGGYELALAWFDFALTARPNVQPVRLNRARALERLARFDEARAAFAAVWNDDRDDLCANEFLNYLLRRGEEREGIALIEDAAPHVTAESRLIMLASAAVLAKRLGEGDSSGYLHRALSVEGVDHPKERVRSLLEHYGAADLALS
jgi:tetratricopeptide (TPR) repeat protein